jgi:ADP-ribose pyrophosphatase YjhB (NUDIX family)
MLIYIDPPFLSVNVRHLMKFCSHCSSSDVVRTIPLGDVGLRYSCNACGTIHYQRHGIVAGCIPVWEDRLLLCRRAIEPFAGLWTIPAGYVEIGETLEEAAMREMFEEVGARPSSLELFAVYNLPMFSEVYTLFLAPLASPDHECGFETEAVAFHRRDSIPWSTIAFPMVREVLKVWTQHRLSEAHSVDTADFFWGPEGAVRVRRHRR